MGLYVRDALVVEVANKIASEHEDYGQLNDVVENITRSVAVLTAMEVLPTEEQLTSCGKVVINLVKLLGDDANPDNPDAVQAVADAITQTLFPYFNISNRWDNTQTKGFELPDV